MLLTCRLRAAITAALATAACSSPPADPCFLGNPAAAPEFEIQVVLADNTVATIADGAMVPMLLPPQGGRVLFVGVRATNIDGCRLQLTGALRDQTTGSVTLDSRTINLTATGDGWGASATSKGSISAAIASFSNIPVCPNQWGASSDLFGHPYWLEVTIADREKRIAAKKIHVIPECAQPVNLSQCQCICMAGYVLGQTCGDAGTE